MDAVVRTGFSRCIEDCPTSGGPRSLKPSLEVHAPKLLWKNALQAGKWNPQASRSQDVSVVVRRGSRWPSLNHPDMKPVVLSLAEADRRGFVRKELP